MTLKSATLTAITAIAMGTMSAHATTPIPVYEGDADLPYAWPPHYPCYTNQEGTVGFRTLRNTQVGFQLASVDLTTGATLNVLDTLDLEPDVTDSQAMRVSGDRLYLLPHLAVVDISDPTDMSILGTAPGFVRPGFSVGATSMAVQGTTVYVLLGSRDVGVFDCSDPTNIVQTATIQIEGSRAALSIDAIGDDKLIIGRSFTGVTIHDSSDPSQLPIIGSISGFQPNTIDVNDALTVAYAVRADTSQLSVTSIDITDPTNPTVLDENILNDLRLFTDSGLVVAIGDNIVAAYFDFGRIELFNTTDPANMVQLNPIMSESASVATDGQSGLVLSSRTGMSYYTFMQCEADLTGDGTLDFFDISAFLTAYNTQDPIADFNADAQFDFFDVSEFLNLYNAGCP